MKKRLDVLISERGLSESREKAKALIMSGVVYVNNEKQLKAGTEFEETVEIIISDTLKYVSRGGYKLEKTINNYGLDLKGRICADIGSSTGGFTDCMLQNNASKVYAVDVGYGQLAWSLRNDPRVVCLERTNARYLTHEVIPDNLDFFSMDVSFISVKLILPLRADLDQLAAELMTDNDRMLGDVLGNALVIRALHGGLVGGHADAVGDHAREDLILPDRRKLKFLKAQIHRAVEADCFRFHD